MKEGKMTIFDGREAAFENRYMHDEDLNFKAHARRNHKLGLWAAQQLGKQGPNAEEYAQALVWAEIEGGGSETIARKLKSDFGIGGVTQSEHQIRRHMDEFMSEAQREVRSA